jgi:hypothetical protein
MKKTLLLLTFPNNIDQTQWVDQIQSNIVSYFGTKFAKADKDYPFVGVDCEVTNEDINIIKKGIDERIGITAIVAKENTEKIVGKFIYLD